MRALEQVRTFVAYPQLNVKFAAGLGGLSGDTDGVTHQATEDISIIRSIPHLKLIVPADATAAKKFVNLMAKIDGPIFMRLGRGKDPIIYKHNQKFKIGESILVKDFGKDLTIIAVGRCVAEAINAANKLLTKGIKTRVIDMHTIKPIDRNRIIQEAKDTGFIVSVEDGNICGGLGSAIAEVIAEEGITYKGNTILFKRLGLVETFGTSGKLEELLDWYHISSDHIVSLIEKIITKK
jgi:transketolase